MRMSNKRMTLVGLLCCLTFLFICLQNASLPTKIRRLDESLVSVEGLSDFYDTLFAWDTSAENQEIQKQVRIRRECEEHPDLDTSPDEFVGTDHPDSHITTISCVPVHYRIPTSSVKDIENTIVYGVLSGNRDRRESVRNTWGKGISAFYVVAGDWSDFEAEYEEYQDLLWIDQPEQYFTPKHDPRKGALTFKSETFLIAMYDQIIKQNPNVEYLFKTDDDCYVDTHLFQERIKILESENKTIDYGGSLIGWNHPDRREMKNWYTSYITYPFAYLPTYATGGGYVVSPKFLECVVGEGHVAKVPYMTLEDSAVGLLAERCDIKPVQTHGIDYLLRKDTSIRVIVQHDVREDKLWLELHELVLAALN